MRGSRIIQNHLQKIQDFFENLIKKRFVKVVLEK